MKEFHDFLKKIGTFGHLSEFLRLFKIFVKLYYVYVQYDSKICRKKFIIIRVLEIFEIFKSLLVIIFKKFHNIL
jgi:hypothetical protein